MFTEKITGIVSNRPELEKVKRGGDIIVVESLSRLGRSSCDLLNLVDELVKNGVKLVP